MLSKNGGYVSGTGNLIWASITALFPEIYIYAAINCVSTPAPLDKIDALLAKKIPVIVEVDFNPSTVPIDQHWILIIGKQGDDYIAADPISGTRILFREKYGDPARYIFRVVCYEHRVR